MFKPEFGYNFIRCLLICHCVSPPTRANAPQHRLYVSPTHPQNAKPPKMDQCHPLPQMCFPHWCAGWCICRGCLCMRAVMAHLWGATSLWKGGVPLHLNGVCTCLSGAENKKRTHWSFREKNNQLLQTTCIQISRSQKKKKSKWIFRKKRKTYLNDEGTSAKSNPFPNQWDALCG